MVTFSADRGIDLTKRGLGSMKKRGPQTGSADISI
jgi:hypothetical protein